MKCPDHSLFWRFLWVLPARVALWIARQLELADENGPTGSVNWEMWTTAVVLALAVVLSTG